MNPNDGKYGSLKRLGKVQAELSALREEKDKVQAKAAKKIAKIDTQRRSLRDERTALMEIIGA